MARPWLKKMCGRHHGPATESLQALSLSRIKLELVSIQSRVAPRL